MNLYVVGYRSSWSAVVHGPRSTLLSLSYRARASGQSRAILPTWKQSSESTTSLKATIYMIHPLNPLPFSQPDDHLPFNTTILLLSLQLWPVRMKDPNALTMRMNHIIPHRQPVISLFHIDRLELCRSKLEPVPRFPALNPLHPLLILGDRLSEMMQRVPAPKRHHSEPVEPSAQCL